MCRKEKIVVIIKIGIIVIEIVIIVDKKVIVVKQVVSIEIEKVVEGKVITGCVFRDAVSAVLASCTTNVDFFASIALKSW